MSNLIPPSEREDDFDQARDTAEEDAWDRIWTRAQAIWGRKHSVPFEAASGMDRIAYEDKAVKELIDEGVWIPERYMGGL